MGTYGVTGSSPLADISKSINSLLLDYVSANWDYDGNPNTPYDPSASSIGFTTNGWDNYGDIDLSFEVVSTNCTPLSTDWRYEDCFSTVNIHVYVRESGESEPITLNKIHVRLKELINQHKTTVIQNMVSYLSSWTTAPEEPNSTKDIWHRIAKVDIRYVMVSTV